MARQLGQQKLEIKSSSGLLIPTLNNNICIRKIFFLDYNHNSSGFNIIVAILLFLYYFYIIIFVSLFLYYISI